MDDLRCSRRGIRPASVPKRDRSVEVLCLRDLYIEGGDLLESGIISMHFCVF